MKGGRVIEVLAILPFLVSPLYSGFVSLLGGDGCDCGYSIIRSSQSSFVVTGYTEGFGLTSKDLFISIFDSLGNPLCTNAVGGVLLDVGYSVCETQDGGFAVVGETKSFGAGTTDLFLCKFSSLGEFLWAKAIGGSGVEKGLSLDVTSEGDLIVTGETSSYGAGESDVLVLRLDGSGNLIWAKSFGGEDDDIGHSIEETQNGDIVITGETRSFGAGAQDIFLALLDSSGSLLWMKTLGGPNLDVGKSVVQTSDGGFVVGGTTSSFGAGYRDAFMARFDSYGSVLWMKTLGWDIDDYGQEVRELSSSNLVLVGGGQPFLARDSISMGLFMSQLSPDGGLLWSWVFYSADVTYGHSVSFTQDERLFSTGETWGGGPGWFSCVLAEFDQDGTTCKGSQVNPVMESVSPPIQVSTPAQESFFPSLETVTPTVTGIQFLVETKCPFFLRGDVNSNGSVEFSDLLFLVDFLWMGGSMPPCLSAADANDDGELDFSDLVYLASFLFLEGPEPPLPYPECAVDPTPDGLSCTTSPGCEE